MNDKNDKYRFQSFRGRAYLLSMTVVLVLLHIHTNTAQRLGLVCAPPNTLTEEDWEAVKKQSRGRGDSLLPCPICQEEFGMKQQVSTEGKQQILASRIHVVLLNRRSYCLVPTCFTRYGGFSSRCSESSCSVCWFDPCSCPQARAACWRSSVLAAKSSARFVVLTAIKPGSYATGRTCAGTEQH